MVKVGDLVVLKEELRGRKDWQEYLQKFHGKTTNDVFCVTKVLQGSLLVCIGNDINPWSCNAIRLTTPPPLESFL